MRWLELRTIEMYYLSYAGRDPRKMPKHKKFVRDKQNMKDKMRFQGTAFGHYHRANPPLIDPEERMKLTAEEQKKVNDILKKYPMTID